MQDLKRYDYTSTSWKEALDKIEKLKIDGEITVYSSNKIDDTMYRASKPMTIIITCNSLSEKSYYKVTAIENILRYALSNINEDLYSVEYLETGCYIPYIETEYPDTPESVKRNHNPYKKYQL